MNADHARVQPTHGKQVWDGARWPGMAVSFYSGIDAAVQREDDGKL